MGGDYKFLCAAFGHAGHNTVYNSLFHLVRQDEIERFPWHEIQNRVPLRTLADIANDALLLQQHQQLGKKVRPITCSVCGEFGHNKAGHIKWMKSVNMSERKMFGLRRNCPLPKRRLYRCQIVPLLDRCTFSEHALRSREHGT